MIHAPVMFSSNEWFMLITTAVIVIVACLLPRRFPASLTILILLYAAAVARVTDHMLAGPAHKDLYDIMDLNKVEYFDVLTYLFYGPHAYIFLYVYDRLRVRGMGVPFYIVLSSLSACAIEWVANHYGVFFYKHWHPFISFSVYMTVQTLTIWLFHYLKKQHQGNWPR